MKIVTFHVDDNHRVTLQMERIPNTAGTDNTLVDIGGVTQNQPDIVSPRAGKIVFNAGPADQEGMIAVRVNINGQEFAAVSDESYHTLKPDPTNDDKSSLISIYPRKANAGTQMTIRGRHLDRLLTLYIGFNQITNLRKTTTSIMFTLPATIPPESYAIRFKDQFMGAVGNSTLRLEVTP